MSVSRIGALGLLVYGPGIVLERRLTYYYRWHDQRNSTKPRCWTKRWIRSGSTVLTEQRFRICAPRWGSTRGASMARLATNARFFWRPSTATSTPYRDRPSSGSAADIPG